MHTPRCPRRPRLARLTRRQSEQLLDGLGGQEPAEIPADLCRFLSSVRATAADGELAGEAAALAAFRSAEVTSPVPQPRSKPVSTLSRSSGLAVKVIAVAAASVAVGGVAVAASGHLPATSPSTRQVTATAHASTESTDDVDAAGPVGNGVAPSRHVSPPTSRPTAPPDARPSTRPTGLPTELAGRHGVLMAVGLCRAWTEALTNAPDTLTRSSALRDLSARAGGPDRVRAYCDDLVNNWCLTTHRGPGSQPTASGSTNGVTPTADGRAATANCARPTAVPPTATPFPQPLAPRAGQGRRAFPHDPAATAVPDHVPAPAPVRT